MSETEEVLEENLETLQESTREAEQEEKFFETLNENNEGKENQKKIEKALLIRLFRFGFIAFVVSITSTLIWMILAAIFDNSDISNAYSLTSPMKYVVAILFSIFGSGACIKKEKEHDENAIGSGFVCGVVVTFLLFFFLSIFSESYINFYGLDVEFYKPFVIYSFGFYFVQNAFYMLMQKLYFEDNEKKAGLFIIIFSVLHFSFILLLSLITKNFLASAIVTLVVLCIYVTILAFALLAKFKLNLNFLTNCKYTSAGIVASIFMFIIYFFGLMTVFFNGGGICRRNELCCSLHERSLGLS